MLDDRSNVEEISSFSTAPWGPDRLSIWWPHPTTSMQRSQWRVDSKCCLPCVYETEVSWGGEKQKNGVKKKRNTDIQLINNATNKVCGNLTFDSLPRKDRNKTVCVRRCFFNTHTLILQKTHCKQSLHLQKALNGATEIYAGAVSPGRTNEKKAGIKLYKLPITEQIPHILTLQI